jgi:3-phytase
MVVSRRTGRRGLLVALVLFTGWVPVPAATAAAPEPSTRVAPIVETQPVAHAGDAADDPALWVNPTDPASSTVIGTDKQGALVVYDLAGRQLQSLPVGMANNVDVRGNLVTFTNRTDDTIGIYRVDPATRRLVDVAARRITTGIQVYGDCMYSSPSTGTVYVFITSETGQIQQWALVSVGATTVDATLVRSFAVGSPAEGCVADDETGAFYVAEEAVGIWQYGAEPGNGTTRTRVASASAGGPLVSDIEGLELVRAAGGAGYLLASSQGSSSFAVYRREGAHAFVGSFTVVAGNGIDAVTGTDGIAATTADLGPAFPSGVFVAQDSANGTGNQDFKLVPFPRVAAPLA